jgi:FkbM family methyltransferase
MKLRISKYAKALCIAKATFYRVFRGSGFALSRTLLEFQWVGLLDGKNTLIDVGAHTGEFLKTYIICFPQSTVYAFEPVKKFRDELVGSYSECKSIKVFPYALGAIAGSSEINVSKIGPATSLLEISSTHEKLWPGSATVQREAVEIRKLDDFIDDEFSGAVLKIDVQGFELFVLRGAVRALKTIRLVQLEVNFENLFEKEASVSDIFQEMNANGFRLISICAPLYTSASPFPVSADFWFARPEVIAGLEGRKI